MTSFSSPTGTTLEASHADAGHPRAAAARRRVIWLTLVLDVPSALFIPRLVSWDPETGTFTHVDGARGFARWEEAEEAARLLRKLLVPPAARRFFVGVSHGAA